MCNYSAFNGYHFTPSDYSAVQCLTCGASWRTKAKYVSDLPDIPRGLRGALWQDVKKEMKKRKIKGGVPPHYPVNS
jgi:hypothetical protein